MTLEHKEKTNGLSWGETYLMCTETIRALTVADLRTKQSRDQILTRLRAHFLAKALEDFKQHKNGILLSQQVQEINAYYAAKQIQQQSEGPDMD